MVGSIELLRVQTRCTLLHSMCDLKATQMNVQGSLIRKLIYYKFEVGHNTVGAIKSIYFAKGEGTVDHSTVTRWMKKFHSDCKNLDHLVGLKSVDFEAVL